MPLKPNYTKRSDKSRAAKVQISFFIDIDYLIDMTILLMCEDDFSHDEISKSNIERKLRETLKQSGEGYSFDFEESLSDDEFRADAEDIVSGLFPNF